MGCNKSKQQHEGPQTHIEDEQISPWVPGQEPISYYGDSFELNQNGMSNVGIHAQNMASCRLTGNQFREYPGDPTGYGYGYSNVNDTGSFGDAAPSYSLSRFTAYNTRVDGSASSNMMYDNFSYEQFQCQGGFDQDQMCGGGEPVMGPPLRAISKPSRGMPRVLRPLARCRSFSDDFRRTPRNAHFNTIARHRSLENIPNAFRMRNSRNNFPSDGNLSRNSSVGSEEFSRSFNQRGLNRRRLSGQRGLKRYSWDDDSLNSSISSDQSPSVGENLDSPEAEPRVKRRPSDIDDLDLNQSNVSTTKNVRDDNIDLEEPSILDNSVERLHTCEETFDILDLLMFPEEWSSCAVDRTGLVNISLNSLEGKSVQKYFSRTSQSKDFKLSITAIARVENPFMHSQYLLKKQEMECRNEHVDELYLYHGTKKEHLPGILEDNLNWRLYSEKHRFGQGVSFSPLATYSSHYSDKTSKKVMLLFKVLTSNSIGGSPDMRVPPIVDKVVYDTSIKDDTTVIVKYSDNEFYPLYKITYFKIMRN